MEHNEKLAQTIEAKWAEEGPTFKTYLRDDLARRQSIRIHAAVHEPDDAQDSG